MPLSATGRVFAALLFFVLLPGRALTQTLPREGAVLNYRIIGFSFPEAKRAQKYTIEIAAGNCSTDASFKKNVISRVSGNNNKIIAEVPAFGKEYTWRVAQNPKSAFHHFATGTTHDLDTSFMRLRVLKKARKYQDAYVFLDGSSALYNMGGQPVWYLPYGREAGLEARDIKLSVAGAITFLVKDAAMAVDYDGNILWKAPKKGIVSRDTSENVHHEFTQLGNGHYMVLGNENLDVYSAFSVSGDSSLLLLHKNEPVPPGAKQIARDIVFGTLIEYDTNGNVVWSWEASRYYTGSDIYFHRNPDGSFNCAVHENSFFFDENNQTIYVSCRDLSRILKIKYPEGSVLAAYGEIYRPGLPQYTGLFCNQHSVRVSEQGDIYLMNNNTCNKNSMPELLVVKESPQKNTLEQVWAYKCTVDSMPDNEQEKYNRFPSGGNILELRGQDLFASMPGMYSKLFIVSRQKEILWSAIPEKWDAEKNKWVPESEYRASIITSRKELEQLIWNAEKTAK